MKTVENMESSDSEAIKILDSPRLKRSLRRRSSLYGSPLVKKETVPVNSKLQYVGQLQNEKIQWLRFQAIMVAKNTNTEPPFTCNMNHLNTELKDFCNAGPDMQKFAVDAKAFMVKLEFYKRMENYCAQKVKYAEDRLKERVDEVTTKLFVDEIEEKIYL